MNIHLREAVPADREKIRSLLEEVNLHTESVDGDVTRFYIAEDGGEMVGLAGFEFYEGDALLRSVAVRPGLQKLGIGSGMVDLMIEEADRMGIRRLILLTQTAKDFFAKKKFRLVGRSEVGNEALGKSSEFKYACPASAVCMMLQLK